jgi:hypothetical protein
MAEYAACTLQSCTQQQGVQAAGWCMADNSSAAELQQLPPDCSIKQSLDVVIPLSKQII